jgi:hypothetical protein
LIAQRCSHSWPSKFLPSSPKRSRPKNKRRESWFLTSSCGFAARRRRLCLVWRRTRAPLVLSSNTFRGMTKASCAERLLSEAIPKVSNGEDGRKPDPMRALISAAIVTFRTPRDIRVCVRNTHQSRRSPTTLLRNLTATMARMNCATIVGELWSNHA